MEAVKKAEKWIENEDKVDLEHHWQVVVDKHRVHSTSEVAAIIKFKARNQL